jgi:hypothetical protein
MNVGSVTLDKSIPGFTWTDRKTSTLLEKPSVIVGMSITGINNQQQ